MKKFEIIQGSKPMIEVHYTYFLSVVIDFESKCWRMHLAHELGHILSCVKRGILLTKEENSENAQMRADKLAKSFLKPKYWDINCIKEDYRKEALNGSNSTDKRGDLAKA